MPINKLLIITAIYFCFISILHSQVPSNSPKGIGLGFTGVTTARDIDAISINPSNLALEKSNNWVFTIIPVLNVEVSNSIINFDKYKKYFTGVDNGSGKRIGKYLSNQDKYDLLNGFPNDGLGNVLVTSELDIFSFSCYLEDLNAGFGFKVRERALAKIDLPKDAFKLALYGNTPGYNYLFDFTSAYGYWLREYALAFGKRIFVKKDMQVNIGFAVKYLSGYGFFESRKVNSNLITTDSSIEGRMLVQAKYSSADFLNSKADYNVFASPAGQGFAFDMGVSWVMNDALTLAASLTDIGFINWTRNIEEVYVDTLTNMTNLADEDQYGPFKDIIDEHTNTGNSFYSILPAGLHIGGSLALHNLNYFKKRNFIPIFISSDITYLYYPNIQKPHYYQLGLGIEILPLKWLPIRTGLSLGSMPASFSFGTGINTPSFDLDIGFGNIFALFGAGFSKSVSLGFGMKFKL